MEESKIQNMPKVLLKFQLQKRIFLTFFLLIFFHSAYSQHKIVIPFGDRINLGAIPSDTRFEIQGAKPVRLKGNKINEYRFETPGNYTIAVEEKKHKEADCSRRHLPKEIHVEVSRVKMSFNQPLVLSSPIVKNSDTQGIILSVPVMIETYDHLSAVPNTSPVSSAGIGTNITAQLKTDTKELSEGKHQLEYFLSGAASQNAYLMFDFIDANGQIQSLPLLTPVKN